MALPAAGQGPEGLCRGAVPGGAVPAGLPAKTGAVGPGQRPMPMPMAVSLPRNSSATRRGSARAAGSRPWSCWGSRSTKPPRKGR